MSAQMNDLVVRCRSISRTYQDDSVPVRALVNVDFEVARGEFVSLAGPSGSGKSTPVSYTHLTLPTNREV